MGNGGYLIPANSKKSMLILGFFNPTDLIIFGTGCVITFILLMTVKTNSLKEAVFIIAPAIFVSFLVLPVPNLIPLQETAILWTPFPCGWQIWISGRPSACRTLWRMR